jgi:hypothetical protein
MMRISIDDAEIRQRLERSSYVFIDLLEKNLRTLGKMVAAKMRRVLEPVKYTGETARSVSSELTVTGQSFRLTVGPTTPHAIYIRMGTKPHWVPIAPLRRWAYWKLGDENAAYPIQKSIAHHGTSVWIERIGLGDGHGGYDYPGRTLARDDVRQGIERTGRRIGMNIKYWIEDGIRPNPSNVGE